MCRILIGDCRERMRDLEDASVDSVVCDPPYHLTSIVKRFGAANAAPAKVGKTGAYARVSKGFMGQTWDGGDVAFDPATWAGVLRVLKPGGHLIAFSGTRTYHRMAVAIEDAGFEIRDQLAWVYGSGFPKSLDVSKAIDKRGGADIGWFGPWLRQERERRGITQKSLAVHFPSKTGGLTGCVANWELGLNIPTPEQFNLLCRVLGLPFEDIAEAEREVIGSNDRKAGWFTGQDGHDITAPSSAAAQQWQGWGTALKPSWEPICLARKPLDGTVANNVLAHGTGALNIDGCRIETDEKITNHSRGAESAKSKGKYGDSSAQETHQTAGQALGRFPANLCHDGSDEVLAGFPADAGGRDNREGGKGSRPGGFANIGAYSGCNEPNGLLYGDSGSAARFFYCAKATTEERGEGNNHPTVKPIALMRWLVRLVTPKDGTVLDPFMGSGSTGIAADAQQFHFIGCELSAEYAEIARRRIADRAGMFADIEVVHSASARAA